MEAGERSDEIKVDVRVSVVKPFHTKWIVKFFNYVMGRRRLIKNDWKESGIMNRLQEKINLDYFT